MKVYIQKITNATWWFSPLSEAKQKGWSDATIEAESLHVAKIIYKREMKPKISA